MHFWVINLAFSIDSLKFSFEILFSNINPYDKKREKSVLKEEYIQEFSNQIDLIEIHNGRNISDN